MSQMSQIYLVHHLAVAAVLSACASRTSRRVAANLPQQTPPAAVLSVTAQKFAFVPREIRVKMNQVVELQLVSVDANHGFGPKSTQLLHGTSDISEWKIS